MGSSRSAYPRQRTPLNNEVKMLEPCTKGVVQATLNHAFTSWDRKTGSNTRWADGHISELTWGDKCRFGNKISYTSTLSPFYRLSLQQGKIGQGPRPFQAPQKHNEILSTERAQGRWPARWWENSSSVIV